MSTEKLKMLKDNQGNVFEFAIAGISYCDGLQEALDLKAVDDDVVHLDKTETITGTKTFSNGATVEGTLTVSHIDGTGVIETDGAIRSTGSTIYSQRTSWPLIGARKIDSNGDLLGYAKLEVDNSNKLRLISADADNIDTSIIKYEDGDFKYIGSAKLSTLNVTGNATVDGNITAGGTISSTGGRFYATKSGTSNCGYEFGNGARYFKFIMNGSQMILQDVGGSGTASPTSNKNVIYSSGSGDSTAYYFNGNASTATSATNSTMATTVKDYGHTSSSSSNEGIMIGWASSSMKEAEYLAVYHYNSTTNQAYIKDMNITDAYHLSLSGRTLGLNFGSSTVISCGTVTLPGTNVVFNQVGTDTNTLYCL